MPLVYLGIGSNLSLRENNCLMAISLLEENGLRITKRSAMYETMPWGVKDQPKFINMAVEAETDISPMELLSLIKKIEGDMGRQPAVKWGPRVIDIDILLYGDKRLCGADLTIPHPLMHEREFILRPLSEIAPDIVHPALGKTIKELFDAMATAPEGTAGKDKVRT